MLRFNLLAYLPRLACRAISRAMTSMDASISRSISMMVWVSDRHEQLCRFIKLANNFLTDLRNDLFSFET